MLDFREINEYLFTGRGFRAIWQQWASLVSRTDELRTIARVAQLYYEDRLKQAQISERLHVSQATVSRLLKRAEEEGVVRVTIVAPRGTYPEFEVGPP